MIVLHGAPKTIMVQTKEQIFALMQRYEPQLKRFGVKRCGLFGSFLRGQPSADSDVDLLVEFEPEQKTFDNFMHLAFFLEETLDRKVDLLTPESLSRHIGPKILREVEYKDF
jgi:predicted nucleotidyltransferase